MIDLYPPLKTVLEKVAAACDRAGVPYAVIGGIAVAAHGVPTMTQDADFVVELLRDNPDRARALATELQAEGFRFSPAALEARLGRGATIMFIHLGLVRADLLFTRPDRPALEHRRRIEYEGREYWFASAEDVVALKLVAGRPKDLEAIKGVLGLKRAVLDRPRLRATVADLAAKTSRPEMVADLERLLAEADALP